MTLYTIDSSSAGGRQSWRIGLCLTFSSLLVLLLVLPLSPVAAADQDDVIIHEGDGLWVLRQPWPETSAWCKHGGGSPAAVIFDVYVYYDSPHEHRMKRLGTSFELFVAEKVLPGIKTLCGSGTAITRVSVGMYKKSDEVDPNAVVGDLSNSNTPPWDFLQFQIDGSKVTATHYEAKEAAFHLSQAELAALDPRSKAPVQVDRPPTSFADYMLYEGEGFQITSSFDRPGTAWCQHVYVPLLVTYEGSIEALDESIQPGYAGFLQTQIVPKIKEICPTFPDADELFRQTLRLEFYRSGESRVGSTMGLAFGDDGQLAWREGRQSKKQMAIAEANRKEAGRLAAEIEAERERRALVAQQDKEARRVATAKPFEYGFIEVECTDTIAGYMHTNTLIPFLKLETSLGLAESKAQAAELAECSDSIAWLIQASNPYASSVKFEAFDASGQLFAQDEFDVKPIAQTTPLDQPEKLALYLGLWKSYFYDVEIRWDYARQEFTGVVTSVNAKGEKFGYAVGDVVLMANFNAPIMVTEKSTGLLTTLFLGSSETEGMLGVEPVYGDYMIFNDGEGIRLSFELIERL